MICSVKQSTAISLSFSSSDVILLRHNSHSFAQISFLRPSMSTTTANVSSTSALLSSSSKKPFHVSSSHSSSSSSHSSSSAAAKFPRPRNHDVIRCQANETDQSQPVETNVQSPNEEEEEDDDVSSNKPTKAAKIHDFCFGIPFGGIVLSGGFVGFLFSRNLSTLSTGVLYGGALLALSTFSMKVWRQGKSSLPFILGQAALAVALLWKHSQNYSLTKKIFPAGFYAVMSAAMLCFYSYVLLSGGNPPPKKLKLEPNPSS